MNNHYAVVGSTDNNYAKFLAVVFASVLRSTKSKDLIDLYCIDGGISDENLSFIVKAVENEGGKVEFLQLETNEYDNIKTIKHITKAAFYRLRIPSLLHNYDKVLYLDCDVIVRDDVTKLWEYDIEKYDVAAVENISRNTYRKTGLNKSDYFNSGVMLMNLSRWRKNNLPEKISDFKKNNPDRVSTNDQCAINCIVNGNWYRLPLKWNHQTGLNVNKEVKKRYSKEEVSDALKYPSIIHFIGADKPWKEICYHPWQHFYIKEAKKDGLDIKPVSNIKLLLHSLKKISLIKKFIRTRVQLLRIKKWQKI